MPRRKAFTLADDSGKVLQELEEALERSSAVPGVESASAVEALNSLVKGDVEACITKGPLDWELLQNARKAGLELAMAVFTPSAVEAKSDAAMVDSEEAAAPPLRPLPTTYYDPLTGLPNRSLFTQWLSRAIVRSERQDRYRFAVLLLDLDRFKIINDSLGYDTGDQLLIAVARRLLKHLRFSDAVARISGDEFTILLDDIEDVSDAVRISERVHLALQDPFFLGGQEVFPTVSIGIALSASGYDRPDEMLQDAETAMYRAKTAEAGYEIFDPDMRRMAREKLLLESDLRRAVERREFVLFYQPIVSLEEKSVIGFEALVRWIHPVRGFVSPGDFIPVAEETGQIVQIGAWVLEEACRQMARWTEEIPGAQSLVMNVNLSRKQLAEPDIVQQVGRVIRMTGVDPSLLHLEITESMVMENTNSAVDTLMQLRELGTQIAIDDFGTGYSSLSCLHRLPIQTIKIDRSFVSRMGLDVESSEIVRTIVSLSGSLGKQVVAEGIETLDQLSRLESLGCNNAQGFLFSRPVAADEAGKLIGTNLFNFAEAELVSS